MVNLVSSVSNMSGDDDFIKWQSALAGTLKECVNYVATHFSDEEKLMKLVAHEDKLYVNPIIEYKKAQGK